MDTIKIDVNKQMDGFTFSIGVAARQEVKKEFPNAYPANLIYINYDTNSGFEKWYGNIEINIFSALLGINNRDDIKKIKKIIFIDNLTDEILHTIKND